MAYSYEQELTNLKNAQINSAKADLENTRNKTISDLENENMKNTANYNAQRNTANIQNKLSAKNFQEYLASTGRANSGLNAQARLQNSNNLNTQLNSITGAENQARYDINRQITNANNAYNSGLAAANANAQANYINNLLDQRYKAQQQANADREFNESVRQFNEQMEMERKKMYSNFSSGGSRSGGGNTGIDGRFTDGTTPQENGNAYNLLTPGAIGSAIGTTLGAASLINNSNKKAKSGASKKEQQVFNSLNNKKVSYQPK